MLVITSPLSLGRDTLTFKIRYHDFLRGFLYGVDTYEWQIWMSGGLMIHLKAWVEWRTTLHCKEYSISGRRSNPLASARWIFVSLLTDTLISITSDGFSNPQAYLSPFSVTNSMYHQFPRRSTIQRFVSCKSILASVKLYLKIPHTDC